MIASFSPANNSAQVLSASLAPGTPRPASAMVASLGDGFLSNADNSASAFAIAAMDILGADLDPSARITPDLEGLAEQTPDPLPSQDTALTPSDTRAALSVSLVATSGAPAFASPDIATGGTIAIAPKAAAAKPTHSARERVDAEQEAAAGTNSLPDGKSTSTTIDPTISAPKAATADDPAVRSAVTRQSAPTGKVMPSGNPLPVGESDERQAHQHTPKAVHDRTLADGKQLLGDAQSQPVNTGQREMIKSAKADQLDRVIETKKAENAAGNTSPPPMTSSAPAAAPAIGNNAEPPPRPDRKFARSADRIATLADGALLPRKGRRDAPATEQVTARAVTTPLPIAKQTEEPSPVRKQERPVDVLEVLKKESPAQELTHAKTVPSQSIFQSSSQTSSPLTQVSNPAALAPTPAANGAGVQAPSTQGERLAAPQLDQAIDQLTEAREASRTARSELTIRHAEFGAVNMRLEAAGGDLRAILANRDPGFVPAVLAALADRAIAAASETSTSSNNQSGSRQSDNGSSTHNQNGGNWGSDAGSERSYGSSLGGERSGSQPSLEQLGDERQNDLSRGDRQSGDPGSQSARERGLFA